MQMTRITSADRPVVGIIMGSQSDLKIMGAAGELLNHLDIPFELTVVSAHRTPQRMFDYANTAVERGLRVIVAGAGGAAHLPGMVASITPLPVVGVPIKASISMDGWDSVLSILQMPPGVPVATVGLDNAKNAGILAAQIIAANDNEVLQRISEYKESLASQVQKMVGAVQGDSWRDLYKKS